MQLYRNSSRLSTTRVLVNSSVIVVPRAFAARSLFWLVVLTCGGAAQTTPSKVSTVYSNQALAFRYTPPGGIYDKTERFRAQTQQQVNSSKPTHALYTLLAMSAGSDSNAPTWGSVTIETFLRNAISELDNTKAEATMGAWVAHSKDASALPKLVVISGQRFTVSIFGLQEGKVRKGAVVFTTTRKGKLLSFAFAANSPEKLQELTESMKTVQFF